MVNCPRCGRANWPENVETANDMHAVGAKADPGDFPVTETFTCAECRSTYRADWEHEFDAPAVVALDESGVEWAVLSDAGVRLWVGWRRSAAMEWATSTLMSLVAGRQYAIVTVTGTDLNPDRTDDGVIENITLVANTKRRHQ